MTKTEKFFAKMQEPSTIKGLVVGLALCGVIVNPEKQEQILIAAGAVYGLIQVFWSKD